MIPELYYPWPSGDQSLKSGEYMTLKAAEGSEVTA